MATIVKRKVKKTAYYLLAGIVAIFVVCILGYNYYNDYKYQQTYEYKLIAKGYTKEESDKLQEKLSEEWILKLLEQEEKEEYLLPLLDEKYYIAKNLETYLEFQKENPDKSTYDIVAMVNIHANLDWYESIQNTDTSKGNLLLVNKFYKLDENYTPESLTDISNWYSWGPTGTHKITKETYEAFIDMYNKALESDIKLIVNSSYRNYKSQESTYNELKTMLGSKRADAQAARPGHSEHETGLALDIFSNKNTSTENFKDSEAYIWLKEHAHEYGFIERYPESKEYLTGYAFESWHWRYVGIEAATQIYNEQITFDEYYAYYIENQG